MALKKCIVCSSSFSGKSNARTCTARCRKRLQKIRSILVLVPGGGVSHDFLVAPKSKQPVLNKTNPVNISPQRKVGR
jgi:hypothetical protein